MTTALDKAAAQRRRYQQRKLDGVCIHCRAGLTDEDGIDPVKCSIEDEVFRSIDTGRATCAAELVACVISKRLHLPAHHQHIADVRAGKRIAGRVPVRRSPEETASRLVDRALQKLRKNGDIVPSGRGWRVR